MIDIMLSNMFTLGSQIWKYLLNYSIRKSLNYRGFFLNFATELQKDEFS